MTELSEWAIPEAAQPKASEFAFDLDRALSSVVALRSEIPGDAFTAPILGTERAGHGVAIRDDGLILTIGYLVTEAEAIWLTGADGSAVRGHVVGYDGATGLGLVQALGRLQIPALALGSAGSSKVGDPVIIAGEGGRARALKAKLVSKREFAGYWEYLLDEALFTSPPHPNWGGAACIGLDGRLQGIGSLFVQEARAEGIASQGNMIVPVDLLPPVLEDLLLYGRVNRPARPWLGMYTSDAEDTVFVMGVADGGPAERDGLRPGDVILEIGDAEVHDLPTMLRAIWALGPAGAEVPFTLLRDGRPMKLRVRSADRQDFLKKPSLH